MRKYTSCSAKWLLFFAIMSALVLLIGVVVVFSNIGLKILLTAFGGVGTILCIGCFFSENSREIIIDDNQIILPRGTEYNGKTVYKKIVINLDKLASIERKFYKGDGIIAKDTCFYTLKLNDGVKITFTLYSYGKQAEKEIIETLQKYIG